jgi:type VI protein secretion system component VasF
MSARIARDPSTSAVRDGSPEKQPYPLWPHVLGLVALALALWLFLVFSVDAHDAWTQPPNTY